MKATDPELFERMERIDRLLAEAEEAKRAHDEWLADWRRRNGIPVNRGNPRGEAAE